MSNPPPTPTTKSRWGSILHRNSSVLSVSQISQHGTPASEQDGDSISTKPKWISRIMHRNSSVLSISQIPQHGTPASERDSNSNPTKSKWISRIIHRNSSLQTSKLGTPASEWDGDAPEPTEASFSIPIVESLSLARESLQREIIGSSPLAQPPAQDIRPASPQPIDMEAAAAPGGEGGQGTNPTGYMPPPDIDSSAWNPAAITGDPEALPQPDVVVDPHAAATAPAETATDASPLVDSSVGKPGAIIDDLDDLPQPAVIADPFSSTPNPVSYMAPVPAERESKPKPVETPALEQSMSYFDEPAESMEEFEFVDHTDAHGDTPTEFVAADNPVIDTPAVAPVVNAALVLTSQSETAASLEPEPAPVLQEAVDQEHRKAASYDRSDPSIDTPAVAPIAKATPELASQSATAASSEPEPAPVSQEAVDQEHGKAVWYNPWIDTPGAAPVVEVAPVLASQSEIAASSEPASEPAPVPQEAVDQEQGKAASYDRNDRSMPIAKPMKPALPTRPTSHALAADIGPTTGTVPRRRTGAVPRHTAGTVPRPTAGTVSGAVAAAAAAATGVAAVAMPTAVVVGVVVSVVGIVTVSRFIWR